MLIISFEYSRLRHYYTALIGCRNAATLIIERIPVRDKTRLTAH